MSSNHKDGVSGIVRVELKYCEHCGGLWVREGGAGVYCERCRPIVAELPAPKKKRAGAVRLPVAPRTVVDDYEMNLRDEDAQDLEAMGGAA